MTLLAVLLAVAGRATMPDLFLSLCLHDLGTLTDAEARPLRVPAGHRV